MYVCVFHFRCYHFHCCISYQRATHIPEPKFRFRTLSGILDTIFHTMPPHHSRQKLTALFDTNSLENMTRICIRAQAYVTEPLGQYTEIFNENSEYAYFCRVLRYKFPHSGEIYTYASDSADTISRWAIMGCIFSTMCNALHRTCASLLIPRQRYN